MNKRRKHPTFKEMAAVEFPGITVNSRQRLYQLRRRRDNRCVNCGKPADGGVYCEEHRIAHAEDELRRYRRKKGLDETPAEPRKTTGGKIVLSDLSKRLSATLLGGSALPDKIRARPLAIHPE